MQQNLYLSHVAQVSPKQQSLSLVFKESFSDVFKRNCASIFMGTITAILKLFSLLFCGHFHAKTASLRMIPCYLPKKRF
jgi:hypothetical protein